MEETTEGTSEELTLCVLKERISPRRNKPARIIGCAMEVHSRLNPGLLSRVQGFKGSRI